MLKSLFYWLDLHPGSYWAIAFGVTGGVLGWLAGWGWRERTPGAPVRATWVDALLLLGLVLAWRWPFLFIADDLNPDESQLIAGAMTLLKDPVFWRSVDGTTSGPLNFYVLLPPHWLGLPLDYFSARLTGLLLIAGALFCCLRAVSQAHGRTIAWAGVLPAAAFFATVTHSDLTHYSSEHLSLFLVALPACLLAIRPPDDRIRLWLALFVAGSAPWAKLQAGPLALVLIGWGAWQVLQTPAANGRERLGRLGPAALAAAAPTLLAIALTTATGQLEHMARRYFLHNLVYVQETVHTIPSAVREMAERAAVDGRFPLFLGTVAGGVLAASVFFAARRVRPSGFVAVSTLLSVTAVLAVVFPRREFLHYVLLLPVPFTLLLGTVLGQWWRQLRSVWSRLVLGTLALTVGVIPPLLTRYWQPAPSIYGSFSYDWRHPRSNLAMVIGALAGKEGTLGIWGWANHLYVETGLTQATRDPHSVWSIVATPQRDYHRALYLADLRRHAPTVFIDAVGPGAFAFEHRSIQAHEIFPELADYVRDHYTLVRDLKEARIYVRKDSPAASDLSGLKVDTLLAQGRDRHRNPQVLPAPVTPFEQLSRKDIGARSVVMLLPPTTVEWKLDDDVRAVTLEFGFDPEAYERGDSNGAEVMVELVSFLQTRMIYRRLLDPGHRPDDRGPQTARIILPPFGPGTHLVVRTGPGEHNNNAWDWVYLAKLQFRRSPRFIPEQFPGFNPVPDQADAEAATYFEEDGQPRMLLHAPASLAFNLEGHEKRLQFTYGFRSGAYRDGGQTDGAIFRVELAAAGQPARVLFERRLDPVREAADRGPQALNLALPAGTTGGRLILTVDPGPAASAAWDWTFVEELKLK